MCRWPVAGGGSTKEQHPPALTHTYLNPEGCLSPTSNVRLAPRSFPPPPNLTLRPPPLVFACDSPQPPWRGTSGSSGGNGGAGKPGHAAAASRGLNQEWAQLWKDMGRDVVEVRGERMDLSVSATGAAGMPAGEDGGGGGGTAGAAGGDPEVVLAPLAKEIERVGVEGGIVGLSEVQCLLAARWG